MKEMLKRRSHTRFEKYVASAARNHTDKLDKGRVSLPSGEGILKIIVSRTPDFRGNAGDPHEQHRIFLEEAEMLKEERRSQHQLVQIQKIAHVGDMQLDFANPEITDVILIGHGSISAIWGEMRRNFDWRMAAKSAKDLKQGKIEQRMCGDWPNKCYKEPESPEFDPRDSYTVALGTFAVTKFTNVIAATGMVIPDKHPEGILFQPVYREDEDIITQIQTLNDLFAAKEPIVVPD